MSTNTLELAAQFSKSLEELRHAIKSLQQKTAMTVAQKAAVEAELRTTKLRLAAFQAEVEKMCTVFEKVAYKNVESQVFGARMVMTMRLALVKSKS